MVASVLGALVGDDDHVSDLGRAAWDLKAGHRTTWASWGHWKPRDSIQSIENMFQAYIHANKPFDYAICSLYVHDCASVTQVKEEE